MLADRILRYDMARRKGYFEVNGFKDPAKDEPNRLRLAICTVDRYQQRLQQ